MKLIINAEVKRSFDPSECKRTADCAVLHQPTGCVFALDDDGEMYLARIEGQMPSLRDVVLAARAAEIFMDEVPLIEPAKPQKKAPPIVFHRVM
jgi:hypothetical protein